MDQRILNNFRSLLEFYAPYNGSFVPTLQCKLSVPSSRVKVVVPKRRCVKLPNSPDLIYIVVEA